MKIVEKYLEAIKTFTDYVTISEWAIKFSDDVATQIKLSALIVIYLSIILVFIGKIFVKIKNTRQ